MLRITSTERNGPRATQRALAEAAKSAATAVVAFWHARYMPAHFTVAGGKKYGYKPRRGDNEPPRLPNPKYGINKLQGFHATKPTLSNPHYSWRKRRQKGHNRPLVWSGQSEQMAKNGVRLSARYSRGSKQVTGQAAMSLPKYFYQYRLRGWYQSAAGDGKGLQHVTSDGPDKAAELTRTTPDEDVELQNYYRARLLSALVDSSRGVGGGATQLRIA